MQQLVVIQHRSIPLGSGFVSSVRQVLKFQVMLRSHTAVERMLQVGTMVRIHPRQERQRLELSVTIGVGTHAFGQIRFKSLTAAPFTSFSSSIHCIVPYAIAPFKRRTYFFPFSIQNLHNSLFALPLKHETLIIHGNSFCSLL